MRIYRFDFSRSSGYSLKNAAKIGGDIRLIKPGLIVRTLMEKVGILKVFNVFDNVDLAVKSYNSSKVMNHYKPKDSEIFI